MYVLRILWKQQKNADMPSKARKKKSCFKVSSRSSKKSANICYCTVIVSVCIFAWNTALATLQEVWSSRLDKCSTHVIAMKSSTALSVVLVQQLAAQALCRRQLRPQPSPPLSRDWRRRRRFRCLFLPHPYTLDLLGDTAAFTLLQRPQSRLCRTTINTLLERRRDKLLLSCTYIKKTLSSCLSEWLAFKEKWPSGQVAINRPKGPQHGLLRCCNSHCFCSQSPQLMSGE